MPSTDFVELVNQQIGHEFAASNQYIAVAVHFDVETLPRLRDYFYRQAVEERNHGMMLIQYLLDSGHHPVIPPVAAPRSAFPDIVEPVQIALAQERRVTEQFNGLMAQARKDNDFTSEQFLNWFLKEQVEEVSSMSDLVTIVERAVENPLWAEEYLGREGIGGEGEDPTAPPAAGGAL
jgi:ferritin